MKRKLIITRNELQRFLAYSEREGDTALIFNIESLANDKSQMNIVEVFDMKSGEYKSKYSI